MNYILRRRRLGNTSCRELALAMQEPISVIRNDRIPALGDGWLFRWGTTTETGVPLERQVNTSTAIHAAGDKAGGRMRMQEAGISVPKSFYLESLVHSLRRDAAATSLPPVIVRPNYHHQGRNLHICSTVADLRRVYALLGEGYAALFIQKSREYRVFVVSGRVAAVCEKIPEDRNAVAWNHALGASFTNTRWGEWPLVACAEAIKATALLGLDFAGVDVMLDMEGRAYVIEANSAPSLTSEYRQQAMAKCFDWVVRNGKEQVECREQPAGWRDLIHPAIYSEEEAEEE